MSLPPLPTIPRLRNEEVQIRDFTLLEIQSYARDYGKACAAAEQDRILRIVHKQANAYGKPGECIAISIQAKVRNVETKTESGLC